MNHYDDDVLVSIPFIAGQWSLPGLGDPGLHGQGQEFQSPSLRGSGRFGVPHPPSADGGGVFQSPSLRGSGRFRKRARGGKPSAGFNPLHCGAVVAS